MDQLIGLLMESAIAARQSKAAPVKTPASPPAPTERKTAPRRQAPASSREPAPAATHQASSLIEDRGSPSIDVVAATFRDRVSLLRALVACEVLGPPPALAPRERI